MSRKHYCESFEYLINNIIVILLSSELLFTKPIIMDMLSQKTLYMTTYSSDWNGLKM